MEITRFDIQDNQVSIHYIAYDVGPNHKHWVIASGADLEKYLKEIDYFKYEKCLIEDDIDSRNGQLLTDYLKWKLN